MVCYLLIVNSIYTKTQTLYDFITITGAVYFSDLFSGLLHIYFDKKRVSQGSFTNTFDSVALSFQEHHLAPRSFIKNRPFYNPRGQIEILTYLTIPVHTFTRICDRYFKSRHFVIFMYTYIFTATFSQILHGFSHLNKRQTPLLIRLLQYCGLVINRQQHRVHHTSYNKRFAIVNGWSNPLLDRLYNNVFNPIIKRNPEYFNVEE